MNDLRTTINTNRGEEGWVDCPIHSSILLDDTEQMLIKLRKGEFGYWYSLHPYYNLDFQEDL